MMYDSLHAELLTAMQKARAAEMHDVVVAIQSAILCISSLQKDSAVLDLLAKTLQGRRESSRVVGRNRGKVFKEDHERDPETKEKA